MKTLLPACSVVVMTLIGLLASLEAYTVIIDPGHGGTDPGAVRPGAYEKQLTLSTSLMLAAELRRLGIPYVMTRSGDETRSLTSRRDLAGRYPGSVFVSIHYNAAEQWGTRDRNVLPWNGWARSWGSRTTCPDLHDWGSRSRAQEAWFQSPGEEPCSGSDSRRRRLHLECLGASALPGPSLPARRGPRDCHGLG